MIDLEPHLDLTAHQAERILERWLGQRAACTGMQRLKGGLVNTVLRLDFDAPPHRAVLKLHGRASHGFAAEAQALRYLRAETACPVPQVFDEDDSARLVPHAFLLIEHVPGRCLDGLDLEPVARIGLERELANVLAQLHEHRGTNWGAVDAVDGPATWADLFASRLADARRHVNVGRRLEPRVLSMVDDAIRIAPSWLADAGSPTLVHGDIWDGNLMVLPDGEGWRLSGLLDPDLQFADVEYELAYLEVFDCPRDDFFRAYRRRHALRPGYEQRRLFYWLYTALVHVALFGDTFFRAFSARTAASIRRLGPA